MSDPTPATDGRAEKRVEQGLQRLEERFESGMDAVRDVVKPRLRGWLHAGTFPLSLAFGAALVLLSPDAGIRAATAVFALTAGLLFGISALYHRGRWSPRAEALLKRFDHANIFLIIAGSYTQFCVLLLPPGQARTLLWFFCAGALAGVAFQVLNFDRPRWL